MATSYQDQCPHRKDVRRIAFTLIEVLVVVAIIALLLSILLPSLARSRDQARRTLCASQLHQLSVAMYAYASDFKGKGPIRGWFSYTVAETNHEA